MQKYGSGTCTICAEYTTMLVWHHTVPQAQGGVDSLQIPLCASCHTILHANADAIIAKIQSGRSIKRTYWKDEATGRRAQKYVGMIVDAVLYQDDNDGKDYKLNVTVDCTLHKALKLLKNDLEGVTNISDAILYCVHSTLNQRGLLNAKNNRREHPKESKKISRKSRSDLW